jgi:hypothetical protein
VKASRAYQLIVRRGPMTRRHRKDRIEVVELESMEVVLFWELPRRHATRVARQIRVDLTQLEAEEFIAAWESA